MSELFQSPLISAELSLKRYFDVDKNLQAWDAADSYLLEEFAALGLGGETSKGRNTVWVLNDNFGALAVSLLAWSAERAHSLNVVVYTDSFLAVNAINNNLRLNVELANERPLNASRLAFVYDLNEIALMEKPDVVIGRVPKSKSQLAYILVALRKNVDHGCGLLLAGMDKHLSKGQYVLLEKYYGESIFMPGKRKSRIWRATCNTAINDENEPKQYQVMDYASVVTLANNFSYGKLDLGARLFIDNMEKLGAAETAVDLACGNGVLGLVYSAIFKPSSILFSDESYQAIKASELNFTNWMGEQQIDENKTQGMFCVDSALGQQNAESVDLIMCNPPFHQQNSISNAVATALFKDAERCLTIAGQLWVVANRHLAYHVVLARLFNNCTAVASNNKFVLLQVVKKQ